MPIHTCCHVSRINAAKPTHSLIGRATSTAKWLLPSAGLVLMPKCPMCVAGYIAVAGVGVSFETADWIRSILIWICIASLALVVFATLRRPILRRRIEAVN